MWLVRYQCGCSADAPRKRDLLEYCGTHGGDAVEWINTGRREKAVAADVAAAWTHVAKGLPPEGQWVETKISDQGMGDWCLIKRVYLSGRWRHDKKKNPTTFPDPTHWHA